MKTRLNAGTWKALRNAIFATLLAISVGAGAGSHQAGDTIELNPDHPDRYVVVKGDTLWDISGMFLRDPWYWPEIWYVNPQIQNPHLIYPGDVLTLVYVDGRPQLRLERGDGDGRLSPRVRTTDLDDAITAIPYSAIEPFLRGGAIISKDEADELPYIAALRDHLIAGAGNEIYVKDLDDGEPLGKEYTVLRLDDKLRDPETNEVLGYEVLYIGNAQLRDHGNPDTLFLTDTDREARRGDKLKPVDMRLPLTFYPKAPEQEVDGTVLSVVDGISLIGQYQMVILNRGMSDGLDSGSVLAIWQTGKKARDPEARLFNRNIQLPDTFAGNVMVVKAYEDVSYALVMEAVSEMRVGDRIANP
ncbi:MAG: LysM peptidoglycan-binding domain-containing protein [Gammaproteobacteria bacterium]|nr:LysM peptidoglycan-binding domain-containing protein [Gammaproteobacteria bacterium]